MELAQIAQDLREKFPEAVAGEQPAALIIRQESLLSVAEYLKNSDWDFSNLHCLTAVDRHQTMEVVYWLYSFKSRFMLNLKVVLPLEDLHVATLSGLWKSANWLEREVYDFYGIKFLHHPDLRRIMNPDEWTDFPLRKNFKRADFIPLPQSGGLKGGA